MRSATACASDAICNVMKLLWNVTGALLKHYGALRDVTESYASEADRHGTLREHYGALTERHGTVTENIEFVNH